MRQLQECLASSCISPPMFYFPNGHHSDLNPISGSKGLLHDIAECLINFEIIIASTYNDN